MTVPHFLGAIMVTHRFNEIIQGTHLNINLNAQIIYSSDIKRFSINLIRLEGKLILLSANDSKSRSILSCALFKSCKSKYKGLPVYC